MERESEIDGDGISQSDKKPGQRYATFWSGIALTLLVGGFVVPFVGLAAIILHSAMTGDRLMDRIGTLLMFIAIPMLLVGSHIMDLIEKGGRKQR